MKRLFLTALFAFAPWMHAQYVTTWVASNGNDANSCLRDGPCRTFAAAYAKTEPLGTIRAVDAADYGPLTITKSITLDGGDSGAAIVHTDAVGITIKPGQADTINIRNITIHSYSLAGMLVFMAGKTVVNVENVSLTAGDIQGGGIGVYQYGRSETDDALLNLRNVSIVGGSTGILMKAGRLTGERLWINNKGDALYLVGNTRFVTLRDSAFHGSKIGAAVTIMADKETQGPMTVVIERSEVSQNLVGLSVLQQPSGPGVSVRLADNLFTGNNTAVSTFGSPQIVSFRNNVFTGNGTDGPALTADSFK